MERLTSRDLREVLGFLGEVYQSDSLEQFLERLLANVPRIVPSELVGYADVDLLRGTSENLFDPPGVNTSDTDRAWESFMLQHPVLAHYLKTRNGEPRKISDFSTERQFHSTDLYNEAYRRMSVEDVFLTFLPAERQRVVTLAIHRSKRSFRERDRQILNLLRPHLTQAWRNAQTLTTIQKEMALLRRAFEQLDRGVVVLDARGRVRAMSERARRVLIECFGKGEDSGCRLPGQLRLWLRHSLPPADSAESLQSRLPLVIVREGKQIAFRLMKDSRRTLLLIDERKDSTDPAALLPLGLTRREAEVLAWVAEGKTNAEVAAILGLSPRTVQKHMEHVTTTLGVETRTAAARIALRTMRSAW